MQKDIKAIRYGLMKAIDASKDVAVRNHCATLMAAVTSRANITEPNYQERELKRIMPRLLDGLETASAAAIRDQ